MRPSLVLHGLRVARGRQLRARALRPLRRRRFPSSAAPELTPLPDLAAFWRSQAFAAPRLHAEGLGRLAVFQQHYGDDVLERARDGDGVGARKQVEAWIDAHPPRPTDAWHPYTTSTRACNWIAAATLVPELVPVVRDSLWRQLAHLAQNVEDDILGNHVIRNARALIVGGAAFGDSALLERGTALLERELPEQVLPDGGHYERSPAYHLLVLRDLLEIREASGVPELDDTINRMLRFSAGIARPDGRPALFNDGGLDIAPLLELPPPVEGLALFPDTGYAVIRTPRIWLAFDCGAPSPDFLPAHAHADALSFQLWVDGRPVVVDPGTYTYEPGADRDWFRGTRSHSTVAVDGDQFELWGAFRSGRLPQVELLEASETELVAGVTGRTGVRHVRRLRLRESELVIEDELEGARQSTIESSLQFAPGVEPEVTAQGATHPVEERRWVSERFFERVEAQALVVRTQRSLPTELGWRIPLS